MKGSARQAQRTGGGPFARSRPAAAVFLLATVLLAAASSAAGESPRTVAVCFRAAGTDEPLAAWLNDLGALVEAILSREEGIEAVERARLDAVLKELGLAAAQALSAADGLRLGRLVRADVLLQGTLVQGEEGDVVRWRVVDVATGTILHASSVRAEAPRLPEIAGEMVRETVRACRKEPAPFATVALGFFENKSNFPRLDCLKLGLRRMVVERLLRIPGLRVLERESVRDLAREAEIGARGPVGRSLVKKERRAAFFVSGEVRETEINGKQGIRVRAIIWRPGRREALTSIERKARLSGLGGLAVQIAQAIAEVVGGRPPDTPPSKVETRAFRETAFLCMNLVGLPSWKVPLTKGLPKPNYRVSREDTKKRAFVLRKAMNAIECALYLDPRDLRIPLQLARCLMLDDAWDYERARHLLENVYGRDPQGLFGACALELFVELERRAQLHTGGVEEERHLEPLTERLQEFS